MWVYWNYLYHSSLPSEWSSFALFCFRHRCAWTKKDVNCNPLSFGSHQISNKLKEKAKDNSLWCQVLETCCKHKVRQTGRPSCQERRTGGFHNPWDECMRIITYHETNTIYEKEHDYFVSTLDRPDELCGVVCLGPCWWRGRTRASWDPRWTGTCPRGLARILRWR